MDDFDTQASVAKVAFDENEPENDGTANARRWLKGEGQAGECLIRIAEAINHGQWKMGTDVSLVEEKLLLPFPETARKLDMDQNALIKLLDDKGWLVTDILSPMRKVREFGPIRGLLLPPEPSRHWLQLIENTSMVAKEAELHHLTPAAPGQPKPSSRTSKTSPATQPKSRSGSKAKGPNLTQKPVSTGKAAKSAEPDERNHPASQTSKNDLPEKEFIANSPQTIKTPVPSRQGDQIQAGPVLGELIASVREGSTLPGSVTETDGWLSVPDSVLDDCLQRHAGISRSALLREIASHPECEIRDGQLRIRPRS